ncbi:MAG: iron dicitrate transport regulator FecR [Planctomycetaceae bacterium]|nr:iron dicitrate transport regulator FecR [Planctomycetaceae bacterium]
MSIDLAAEWLRSARKIVVFTGAGMSAESGISTFRDQEGLWQHFRPEEFGTWTGLTRMFLAHPERAADFLYALLEPIAGAKPNAGHLAIAALERHARVTVVTQNIDNLHQEAGSTLVHEVHGSLFEIVTQDGRFVRCVSRQEMASIATALGRIRHGRCVLPRTLVAIRPIAGIGIHGRYRPGVVLFGDAMAEPAWGDSVDAVCHCDCLIQVGCSNAVYPAATLPREAKAAGAKVIAVNPEKGEADVWLRGTASDLLPKLLEAAFGSP